MGNLFFANMLIIIIHQCACAAVQSEAGGAFWPPYPAPLPSVVLCCIPRLPSGVCVSLNLYYSNIVTCTAEVVTFRQ